MKRNKTKGKELYFDQVTDMYFNLGVSTTVISKKLSLPTSTIWNWICIFAEENGIDMSKAKYRKSSCKSGAVQSKEDNTAGLLAEIRRLGAELKKEKLRAALYDEIINVAEERFNIKIRKKAGAKR